MHMPKKVIIVEDEAITQRFLMEVLQQHQLESIVCFDNASDLLGFQELPSYDIILMDINIKGSMDGIQLARKILGKWHIPIIFITAHNDEDTLGETLELSPYGFICKPFTAKDVNIAIQIAQRQYLVHKDTMQKDVDETITRINAIYHYDHEGRQLYRKGEPVGLTKNQNALVELLVQNIHQTTSFEALVSSIWGEGTISDSALRTLVYSLRKLLPDLPLVSHSKIGYSLEKK